MRIQCNACETAEASVLCCADEAALCGACDEEIHAANKLVSKHVRVPLSNFPSQMPKCDICQETTGYFFCLEDRALLCWKCDVAIHTANAYVSAHQRFLLTGVKVGFKPKEAVVPYSENMNSIKKATGILSKPLIKRASSPLSGDNKDVTSNKAVEDGGLSVSKLSYSGGSAPGIIPDWPLDDFLGLTDFDQNCSFMEQGSSKIDNAKLEDSGWSPLYHAAVDEDVNIDEHLGQVPQIPSPPTASGLYWPNSVHNNLSDDNSVFVPDICYRQSFSPSQLHLANPTQRRQL